jgi:hypothetical protein
MSGQWNPIPATVITPSIPSAAENGSSGIQGREVLVQGTLDGNSVLGEIILYWDPLTRSFLWLFVPAGSGSGLTANHPWLGAQLASVGRAFAFAANDGVYFFEAIPEAIRVFGPSGMATSLDDAQTRALTLLAAHTASVHGKNLVRPQPPHLSLSDLIFKRHVIPPTASMGMPKIHTVSRQGKNWEIVLELMGRVIDVVADPNLKILNATVLSVTPKR